MGDSISKLIISKVNFINVICIYICNIYIIHIYIFKYIYEKQLESCTIFKGKRVSYSSIILKDMNYI